MSRNRFRRIADQTGNMKRYVNSNETHSLDTTVFSHLETMEDIVTPGYQKRSNEGEIINNPMRYVKDTFKATAGGIFDVTQSGTRYEANGDGSLTSFMLYLLAGYPQYSFGIPPMPEPSFDLVAAAQSKALGNVDRAPNSFAEDIAEMRQTLRFLKDPLSSLRNLSKKFQRTRIDLMWNRKDLDRAKAIAKVWNTFQFAFLPLVRSANDLIEAYGVKTYRPSRRTARGGADFNDTVSESSDNPYYHWSASATLQVEQKAGILYEVTNPINDWRFKYGLRFKDIPETLWAIFPYSFMVDRMINISQSVRGMVSFLDPSVNILAGWTTEKSTTTGVLSFTDYTHPAVSAKSIHPDVDIDTNFVYNREVWKPGLSDSVGPLRLEGLVDTTTKIADLAALILQRVK